MLRMIRSVVLAGFVTSGLLLHTSLLAQRSVAVVLADQNASVALSRTPREVAFTVTNTGTQDEVYGLACEALGAVTSCSLPDRIVRLRANQTANVRATFSVGLAGEGSVRIKASSFDGTVLSESDYAVKAAPPAVVSVSPDGDITEARPANASGQMETFTVTFNGPTRHTFELSCDQVGAVTCEGVSQPNVTIDPGSRVTVTVSYSTGDAGYGTILLTARSSEDATVFERGAYNVRINPSTP